MLFMSAEFSGLLWKLCMWYGMSRFEIETTDTTVSGSSSPVITDRLEDKTDAELKQLLEEAR